MQRVKLVGMLAAAVFAAMSAMASAAFAVEKNNPFYEVETVPFESGTESVTGKQKNVQTLTGNGEEIQCQQLKATGSPQIEGFAKPAAGKNKETLEYSECKVTSTGSSNCEARTKGGGTAGTIDTKSLESKLVYESKSGAENETGNTETLFKPTTGNFVELEFKVESGKTGTCPSVTEVTVSGSVALENINGSTEEKTKVLKAPSSPIAKVYENTATENGHEVKVSLKAFGFLPATYVGESEVELSGTKAGNKWSVHT
jgi:hypothetical protein